MFEIRTRATDSRARTGTLHLAHGDVQTPAFVPLATRGAVKTLEPRDVEALGYEMVLGNTFHLYLSPGAEALDDYGGLNEFMRWHRPIITDSGGFQVFSMGHGSVADEIKGRGRGGAAAGSSGSILSISEEGVRFRSYIDGGERFMAPETSMAVQAALRSDIALVFDECTPFHVTRDYTARSTERTHRWLERCLDWHAANGPRDQLVYGIVQGGVELDLRTESAQTVAASRCGGVAIGGSLGQDKPQMHTVVDWSTAALEQTAPERPRHLLGIGDIDDLLVGRRARHRHVRLRDADAARPPRRRDRPRARCALARRSRQGAMQELPGADHATAVPAPPARLASRADTSTTQSRPVRPPARAC